MKLNEYTKSIVAGLVTGLLMFFTLRGGGVNSDEWQLIITSILASSGLTWAVPNRPQQPPPTSTLDIDVKATSTEPGAHAADPESRWRGTP